MVTMMTRIQSLKTRERLTRMGRGRKEAAEGGNRSGKRDLNPQPSAWKADALAN